MSIDVVITDLCVGFVVHGAVDVAEVNDAYEWAWAHPDFRVGMPYFVDLRDGTIAQFEKTDTRRIASFIRSRLDRHGHVKTVLLCERPADFGIARTFEAYAHIEAGLAVRVCRSEEDVLPWLRGEIK